MTTSVIHTQSLPSKQWVITIPNDAGDVFVQAFDSDGQLLMGSTFIRSGVITIHFNRELAGKCHVMVETREETEIRREINHIEWVRSVLREEGKLPPLTR